MLTLSSQKKQLLVLVMDTSPELSLVTLLKGAACFRLFGLCNFKLPNSYEKDL